MKRILWVRTNVLYPLWLNDVQSKRIRVTKDMRYNRTIFQNELICK